MAVGVVRQLRPCCLWAVCLYAQQVRVLLVQGVGGGTEVMGLRALYHRTMLGQGCRVSGLLVQGNRGCDFMIL
jgi:hypothetical protein